MEGLARSISLDLRGGASGFGAVRAKQAGARRVNSPDRRQRAVIAIIGDRFMSPSKFETAIRDKCGDDLDIRSHELRWPDEPMLHGYAEPGMEGLKEYQGTADEIVGYASDAEIVVTQLAPFSASVLERLPRLRLIAVSRGGPVNIDMAAARQRRIRVVNAPGRNASAVAEFTIGAILAETRLIARGHENLRRGEWRGDLYRADLTGRELSEMTVGVIGYGHVGTKVVRLLKPFGCRLLVCDPYVQLSAEDVREGVAQVAMPRLLGESDVVTLHARVTSETQGFIGAQQFAAMKPGAYFINTARGPLVDYDALTLALKSRRLRGAALDTFAIEPAPADLELLRLDNATLTPHIAGASVKTVKYAAEAAAEEVRRYLAGEGPLNPC
jgi:D-3-phosphoglycerate dehydrogenase / 2-oxoglutarate reductase